ncbi:DUF2972 domain-containing protein [Helicobacter muridarum]|uniref:Protein of uncharacterized function (DUF2972) n=1 Tax=Helicobacter muridarum TaxID=216 RepID=A0A099TZS7_9HELI|nr:DUF2972 domain-containing protein [Helicobacter muridarum]STQ85889.1 Protein of uncharacterised function (DUF2972) [Helicobacter muridarum]
MRSKEFQEKYINTNHPYPPLLNPRTARYSKIPALLAWELNLPLPSGYGFIFLAIHGCGAGAMQVFLEECNIATNSRFDSDRDIYFTHFKNLVFRRDKYIAIWARAYNFESSKLYYLLDSNVPAICVVRDPISLIKPLINHLGNKGFDRIPVINLGDNYEDVILPAEYYYASKNDIYTPSLDRLPDVLSSMKNSQHTLRIRIELLSKNLTNIHYIPFEDIGTSKAFDTLYALSKKYGFDSPKRREVFETKINGSNRSPLFPFTLVCDKNSNIELIVLRVCDNKILDSVYVDMTSILYDGFNPYGIRIIAKKDVYDALQFKLDLLKDISKYIDGYIQALIRIDEIEMKKQFNEEDIIEYLKSNINLAREFKIAFDLEYADVKSRRADIVEKWAYYQEFEKIC